MREVAYLSSGFRLSARLSAYREVAELERQGDKGPRLLDPPPGRRTAQDWDERLVARVHYLPEEKTLVAEVDRHLREAKRCRPKRGRPWKSGAGNPIFCGFIRPFMSDCGCEERGLRHVHAHFAGMAARTAYWIREFFGIPYSFTAHANDIFAPRDFVVSLAKLIENAAAVVTVSDYAVRLLQERFPRMPRKVHRVYNGVDLSRFSSVGLRRQRIRRSFPSAG